MNRSGRHVKDLSRVERSLSRLVIIDNTPCAYSMHEGVAAHRHHAASLTGLLFAANAVPISSFTEDSVGDDKLLTLLPFLESIHGLQDVRSVLGLRVAK